MPIYSYNTKSGDKLYRVSYRDPNHIQLTKRGFRRRQPRLLPVRPWPSPPRRPSPSPSSIR
ncbi:hypothetical protein DXC37_09835 [Bifidobacterium bifidum]|uniref:Uncharacterized protein n=1 Tax=Bifidobacterium bifidum TaxID=1681 RepID=A0A415C332_BIFBI|nr:hypothetical protein F8273_09075 [Bifidobacterium bifidum]RGJ37952.1 hypothetical protein DXD62_08820 [Bifidobacterium bifidum]RGJ55406.1 hypothetical protein DXD53_08835 [Bifidobacterium bifidum]RGL94613.1 hypothetical protein DXC37_09835 [Bifidobacterium bifidum]RGW58471.1 hypothetical protein DWV62_09430 [Bifidobacterium bifidum]